MAKNCIYNGVDGCCPCCEELEDELLREAFRIELQLAARFAVLCWSTPVSMERSGIFVAAAARQEQTR
jgi:hypothetical protein